MSGPLSHIRVLDLSRVLAGPWASQLLGDLGAEVIKIERPGTGDDTRSWGPPFLKDEAGNETREAAYYLATNRAKKSVAVDFSTPEGGDLIRRLAALSDVVIENFKVGALARYRLAYEDLKAVNPGLVYCSITGFGQTGPLRERPGYDFIIQAMGGLMSVTGERDDRPGGGPQKVGVAVADLFTGMYASVGILAALAHRERTGEGQYIDLALLDSLVATLATQHMNYFVSGRVPERQGNAHANIVPYQVFRSSDGHLVIGVGNDGQFKRFCTVTGLDGLAEDARFATNAARVRNRDELIERIVPVIAAQPSAHWIAAFDQAGVPCGPVNRLDEVFADPQIRHRELHRNLPHPLAGQLDQVVSPLRFSATPCDFDHPPPLLGQHTDAVLGELLDLSEAELASLREAGVIG